jgi:hypothetical protein
MARLKRCVTDLNRVEPLPRQRPKGTSLRDHLTYAAIVSVILIDRADDDRISRDRRVPLGYAIDRVRL